MVHAVKNTIIITGDVEPIKKVIKQSLDDCPILSFSRFLPCPDVLFDVKSAPLHIKYKIKGIDVNDVLAINEGYEQESFPLELIKRWELNYQKYGATDSNDWLFEILGGESAELRLIENSNDKIVFYTELHCGDVKPFVINLSKKYPNAKFEVVIETSRRGKLITRRLRCVNGKEVEIS
jgi:hypothetical protein